MHGNTGNWGSPSLCPQRPHHTGQNLGFTRPDSSLQLPANRSIDCRAPRLIHRNSGSHAVWISSRPWNQGPTWGYFVARTATIVLKSWTHTKVSDAGVRLNEWGSPGSTTVRSCLRRSSFISLNSRSWTLLTNFGGMATVWWGVRWTELLASDSWLGVERGRI